MSIYMSATLQQSTPACPAWQFTAAVNRHKHDYALWMCAALFLLYFCIFGWSCHSTIFGFVATKIIVVICRYKHVFVAPKIVVLADHDNDTFGGGKEILVTFQQPILACALIMLPSSPSLALVTNLHSDCLRSGSLVLLEVWGCYKPWRFGDAISHTSTIDSRISETITTSLLGDSVKLVCTSDCLL